MILGNRACNFVLFHRSGFSLDHFSLENCTSGVSGISSHGTVDETGNSEMLDALVSTHEGGRLRKISTVSKTGGGIAFCQSNFVSSSAAMPRGLEGECLKEQGTFFCGVAGDCHRVPYTFFTGLSPLA